MISDQLTDEFGNLFQVCTSHRPVLLRGLFTRGLHVGQWPPVKSSLGGSLARGNRSKYRPSRDLGANELNIEDRSEAFTSKGFDFFGSGKTQQTSLEDVDGEEFIGEVK